jgi:hypothetical protein
LNLLGGRMNTSFRDTLVRKNLSLRVVYANRIGLGRLVEGRCDVACPFHALTLAVYDGIDSEGLNRQLWPAKRSLRLGFLWFT